MRVIGIESEGAGTNNQMRGVILEAAGSDKVPVTRDELLKADDGTLLSSKNFADKKSYIEAIDKTVAKFCMQMTLNKEQAPQFVVLPYGHSNANNEKEEVDNLSEALKNSFAKRGISIKTMVIASNVHDYQNVDLVHVGRHQIKPQDEALIKSNPHLSEKIVQTLGVPSNLSWLRIRQEANSPLKKAELEHLRNKKNVLFSLGGKTDNGAISFTVKDAENLLSAAKKLKVLGYHVIFTNSPRTPNDVTDFLYEKCKLFNMDFYNSKQLAQNPDEAEKNFRIYDGNHKDDFAQQAQKIGGNIYPAILDVCDFVVNTHDSFSYTSDAAALNITSVVYTGNEIDFSSRPDCKKLFDICEKGGYAISLDQALDKLTKGQTLKTKELTGVSKQLVQAMCNICQNQNTKSYDR